MAKPMGLETKGNVSGCVVTGPSEKAVEHVAEKYRGTATDQREMEVLGKQQVLRVSFVGWDNDIVI